MDKYNNNIKNKNTDKKFKELNKLLKKIKFEEIIYDNNIDKYVIKYKNAFEKLKTKTIEKK